MIEHLQAFCCTFKYQILSIMRKVFALAMIAVLALGISSCASSKRGIGCPGNPTAIRR